MSSLSTKRASDLPELDTLADTDRVILSPSATPDILNVTPISIFVAKVVSLLTLALSNLTDIDFSTPPTNLQSIRYNSSTSKWIPYTPPSPGASALTGLTDVVIASPTNLQALAYDTGTAKWTNQSLAISGSSLFTTMPQFIGSVAKKSADQTLADYSTATAVAWDAEDFDTDAFHSNVTNNDRLTIPAGLNIEKVVVAAKIALDVLNVGTSARLELRKNGTAVATTTVNLGNVTNGGVEIATLPIAATATDYFQVYLRVSGTIGFTVLAAQSRFSVQVVGATATPVAESLTELVDVDTTGVTDKNILRYDLATTLWKPVMEGAVATQTADYTFALGDAYTTQRFNKATAINGTVPPNSSVALPVSTEIEVGQVGVGTLTIVAGAGVTINAPQGLKFTQFQYGRLRKTATDTWSLVIFGLNYTTPLPEQSVTSGTSMAIDRMLGEIVRLSLTGTVTAFTVSNWPATGTFGRIVLEIANTGAFNITTWPTGTIWPGATAPTITSGSGKKDIIILMTFDGGTTIYGSIAGQDYR